MPVKGYIKVDCVVTSSTSPWGWRQRGLPKRRYPTVTLHGVTTHKIATGKLLFVTSVSVFKKNPFHKIW